MIWSDDFTGPAGSPPDPSKWTAVTGGDGWGNQELEYYTDRTSNVALDGAGHLDITARDETYTGPDGVSRDYTSARLQTKGHFDFQYGEVDARIQLPQGEGLWPAFWGLGSNIDSVRWPWCGEFDVMENLGSPYTIYGSVHGTVGHTAATTEVSTASSLAAGYHVYGMIWSPDSVTLTLDGDPYASYSPASLPSGNAWEFDSGPFYLLLDLAVGGWAGTPSPATPFPATMSVDWVRVYN